MHGRYQVEEPAGHPGVAGKPAGGADRLGEIRNRAATPAADLIAKQAQPADVAAADGARGHHPSTRLITVRRRRDFDRVAIAVQADDERRVIEVASWPMSARGLNGLEDPAVEANAVTTRPERNPMLGKRAGRRYAMSATNNELSPTPCRTASSRSFEKTGVGSRRALVATLLLEQYLPRAMVGQPLGPSGFFAS